MSKKNNSEIEEVAVDEETTETEETTEEVSVEESAPAKPKKTLSYYLDNSKNMGSAWNVTELEDLTTNIVDITSDSTRSDVKEIVREAIQEKYGFVFRAPIRSEVSFSKMVDKIDNLSVDQLKVLQEKLAGLVDN